MEDKIKKTGYKASYNGVCRDQLYEVGKTYTKSEPPIICVCGFHYCTNIDDVFTYYPYKKGITKIFEIEDLGEGYTECDKSVTNAIKIIREIPVSEYNDLFERYKFDVDGNKIRRKYLDGSWEAWEYDARGNMTRRNDSTGYWITYEYDSNGRRTRSENSAGYLETSEYDSGGNKIRCGDSDGYYETYGYDSDGNRILCEGSDGHWTAWKYDANGVQVNRISGKKTLE